MSPTKPIRAVLVDDEAPARARLRHLLRDFRDIAIVAECSSGSQAVGVILRERPDLLFLDIQMPRMSGFDVCSALGAAELPLVVFVTAYDEYALRAFQVHAVDYLLKPVDRDRFREAIDQIRRRRHASATPLPDGRIAALLEMLEHQPARDRFVIRVDGRAIFLRYRDVLWLEADGNYLHVHAGDRDHLVRETLTAAEARLPQQFLRISRSAIINLDAVVEVQPLFYGDYSVILRDGKRLTLSRTHRTARDRLLGPGA